MSLIIHRCTECGDPDFWHRDHLPASGGDVYPLAVQQ